MNDIGFRTGISTMHLCGGGVCLGEHEVLGDFVDLRLDGAREIHEGEDVVPVDALDQAQLDGIALEVVKLPEAKRGFVLLPRRWVVERSFAWATRFRRLVKDYERYAETLAGLHIVAFAYLMMKQAVANVAGP